MTFLHFINCAALTFTPYYLFYKATKLSEYNAYLLCIYAALAYIVTQLAKLLLFATFVPMEDGIQFDFIHELLKSLINLGDIVGIYFILNLKGVGTSDVRILGVGLGWAFAESVIRRLVPLWLGARQIEFGWEYIQMAIHANISLISIFAFTTLIWLWDRSRTVRRGASTKEKIGTKKIFPYIWSGMAIYALEPVLSNYLSLSIDAWYVIIIHATTSIGLGWLAYWTYSSYNKIINIK